jgi:hypothetical protein
MSTTEDLFAGGESDCPGRDGSWKLWLRRAGAAGALALFAAVSAGQEETPAAISEQLWANIILGYPKSARFYYELDLEPKSQIRGGETWRNIDATPLVEFYPNNLVDLTGEVTFGHTRQNQAENSIEITPRIGVRLHLFKKLREQFDVERVPLSRLSFANLLRIEFRNFWFTEDRASSHETRFRNRTELKLAINHDKLSMDRTLYFLGDVEFFFPVGEDVPERFATKRRFRGGFGYRRSRKWRFEVLYIQDAARETLDEEEDVELKGLDLRIRLFF